MMTYTQKELQKILKQHKLWLDSDGEKGRRADLSHVNLSHVNLSNANLYRADLINADLSHANLTDANLTGAYLSHANLSDVVGKIIIIFQANKHFAYYADGYIKIGCLCNTVEWWLENYKRIGKANYYSKEQIKRYGDWIKMISKTDKENKS